METLMGSKPKANFSTQPTILPQQQELLTMLSGLLQGGQKAPGAEAGTYAAPLNQMQTNSLAGLEALTSGQTTSPAQANTQNHSLDTLNKALDFQAPHIDSTQAFQQGVVEPLTGDFLSKTIPAISGAYGGSAGGAYSSGRNQSAQQAGETLDRSLSQTGAKFALDAATANQSADLTANQQRLGALTQAPSTVNMPQTTDAGFIENLMKILQGGSVPYNVAQTQISGVNQQSQTSIADMIAAALSSTQQTLGVGTGGTSGLLGGALGSPALGAGITALFSDARLKDDVEQVGEVAGFPLYKYRYKGETRPRLGLIAQDVEKRLPHAVGESGGYKTVDYAAVLEHVFAEAA